MPVRNVIVLDRDGTLVADSGYLDDPAGLRFLPAAAAALRWFDEHGFRLVVVTNQSGVGRGRIALQRLHEIHERLQEMVEQAGARLEGIYFCPHLPDAGCACRKPQSGLLERASSELGFALSSVIVIGDRESDVQLGRRVSAPAILLASAGVTTDADFVAGDLLEATRIVARIAG